MRRLFTRDRAKAVALGLGKLLLIGGGSLALYIGVLFADGNFHVVVPGQFYRSAQPTPDELADYHQSYGIKTVVNLRGSHPNAPWYRAERDESRKLGITLIDIHLWPDREITEAQAAAIIALLKHAKKPILVHCSRGADRTSLVTALYLAGVAHRGEEAAESQISVWYGHFALPLMPNFAMDDAWEALEPWLGFKDS